MTPGRSPFQPVACVFGLIPAAGQSRRMGPDTPKQLMPFRGRPLLEHMIQTLLDAGLDGLVVVTRSDIANGLDLTEDPRFLTVINDDPASEMIDSVRIGLAAVAGAVADAGRRHVPASNARAFVADGTEPAVTAGQGQAPRREDREPEPRTPPAKPGPGDGLLVCPGDMPGLTPDAVRRAADAYRARPGSIVVTTHQGRSGHPIVVPLSLQREIDALREGGLNRLRHSHPELVYTVECHSAEVLTDVDTPADYDDLGQDKRREE